MLKVMDQGRNYCEPQKSPRPQRGERGPGFSLATGQPVDCLNFRSNPERAERASRASVGVGLPSDRISLRNVSQRRCWRINASSVMC